MTDTGFKIIQGSLPLLNTELNDLTAKGWKPLFMTSTIAPGGPVIITVMLQHFPGA